MSLTYTLKPHFHLTKESSMMGKLGASLKDLGKKWFAFSKMNIDIDEMLNKLSVEKKIRANPRNLRTENLLIF